jgi:hypothetical protein
MPTGQALVNLDMSDEREIRLQKMFGITHGAKIERGKDGLSRVVQGAPYPEGSLYSPFNSFREAWIAFSGDSNLDYVGKNVRATQVAGLPTAEQALGNVCNRLLLQDYDTDIYGWRRVVTSFTSPPDFRANERVRLNYLADLPDVLEDAPFTDPETISDNNQSISYVVNEKGILFPFTRRVIIDDDIEFVKRVVAQASRAAWRTLAKRVWNLLVNNTTYGADRYAVFSAQHGNLGSAPLSASALTAGRAAIFAQTEPNGPDSLALGAGPLLLVIPIQLEATALPLNHAQWLDSSYTLNPWIHRFGKEENENILVNPLCTSATNWFLFDVSGKVGIIEVGFLQGAQYPQVVQSGPMQTDAAFYQDRAVFKLRHEYECAIIDYRGAYMST